MNPTSTFVAILALVAGLGGGYYLNQPVAGNHMMADGTMMDDDGMSMGSAMHDMMAGLEGKKGDDFDKAFLSEMIVHHQGAVDMAQAALTDAKHDEIKQMAQAIITAQTAEIAQMKAWEKTWYQGE